MIQDILEDNPEPVLRILRKMQYLDRLAYGLYHTRVFTESNCGLPDCCEVTLIMKPLGSACATTKSFTTLADLDVELQAALDNSRGPCATIDWITVVAHDPSPGAVGLLGGYLDVPTNFFAAHGESCAVIQEFSGPKDIRKVFPG